MTGRKGYSPLKGCFLEGILNCVFSIIALPLGLWLLGYGIYLLVKGEGDYGVFLILLGLLLLAAVGSGFLRGRPATKSRGDKQSKKAN